MAAVAAYTRTSPPLHVLLLKYKVLFSECLVLDFSIFSAYVPIWLILNLCGNNSRIRTRLGFEQKGIVMYINKGSENGDAYALIMYVLGIGMLACFFFLAQNMYHNRRRGRVQRRMQREQSNAEESVATNCSTEGVYNGVREKQDHTSGSQVSVSDGERMHLLANKGGALYT